MLAAELADSRGRIRHGWRDRGTGRRDHPWVENDRSTAPLPQSGAEWMVRSGSPENTNETERIGLDAFAESACSGAHVFRLPWDEVTISSGAACAPPRCDCFAW